jgi:cbb3-type cytochrome oxidase cytochrome c subunit
MKGLTSLFLGVFATFAFSWMGLALVPNSQIGHLDPQTDEEWTDIYPMPPSGMAVRGRKVYTANGCFYCHSQQVRPAYAAADIDRKWGDRRSAPRDYIFARPVLLGKMRMGPDLSNIGKRAPADDQNAPAPGASPGASLAGSPAPNASPAAGSSPAASAAPPAPAKAGSSPAAAGSPPAPAPSLESETKPGEPPAYSAAWHHRHLYSPRSINIDSNMPAYRFLYEKRWITGERSADALTLTGEDAPPEGYEIVPSYDANCLVAFLMSLDQSHPLKEVKPLGGAAPAAASPSPAAAGKPPTK